MFEVQGAMCDCMHNIFIGDKADTTVGLQQHLPVTAKADETGGELAGGPPLGGSGSGSEY